MGRLVSLRARLAPVAAVGVTLLAPGMAWAQDVVPQPDLNRAPKVWLGYLVMVVLISVVMAVSLMPSKRSHQD